MNKLRDIREDHDMNQVDLAGKLSVSRTAISRWENEGNIPAEYLPKIAEIFGISIEEILGLPAPVVEKVVYKDPELNLAWYIRQLPRFNNMELAQIMGACNYVMGKRTDNSLKTEGSSGDTPQGKKPSEERKGSQN